MKKNMGLLISLFLAGIVAVAGASAFGLGIWQDESAREEIRVAIEDNDFSAWKEAVTSTLTEENFNNIARRHTSMSDRHAQMEAVRQAIDDGDYNAYAAAVSGLASVDPISEEDFAKLVELHAAMEDGDYDTAADIREELGTGAGMMQGFANGMRQGRGGMGKMHLVN